VARQRPTQLRRQIRTLVMRITTLAMLGVLAALAVFGYRFVVVTPYGKQLRAAQTALAAVDEGMLDQETGLRGFAATGARSLLQPYYDGINLVANNGPVLASTTTSDSTLGSALVNMRVAQEAWTEGWAATAVERANPSLAFINQGKSLFDTYRATEVTLQDDIAADISSVSGLSDRLSEIGLAIQAMLGIAIMLVWFQGTVSLRTSLALPLDDLMAEISRLQARELDATVAVDGPEEIQMVSQALETMRLNFVEGRTLREQRERELAGQAENLKRIVEMSRSIAGSLNIRYVLAAISVAAVGVGGCRRAVIWTLNADDDEIRPQYDSSRQHGRVIGIDSSPLGDGVVGKAARFGRVVGPESINDGGGDYNLAVPMIIGARVVGVIEFRGSREELDTADAQVELLDSLANQAATAIEAARLFGASEHRSQTDALTQLGNRRKLDTDLAGEYERSKRHERSLSFVMLDVDHFKQYNDAYGHHHGDEALQELAEVLQGEVRGSDQVYRYGGEEFAIVLPETDAESAVLLCERIRSTVDKRFARPTSLGKVTISMGVAGLSEHIVTEADLIRSADAALYHAKHSGRNCVKVSQGSGGDPGKAATELSGSALR